MACQLRLEETRTPSTMVVRDLPQLINAARAGTSAKRALAQFEAVTLFNLQPSNPFYRPRARMGWCRERERERESEKARKCVCV